MVHVQGQRQLICQLLRHLGGIGSQRSASSIISHETSEAQVIPEDCMQHDSLGHWQMLSHIIKHFCGSHSWWSNCSPKGCRQAQRCDKPLTHVCTSRHADCVKLLVDLTASPFVTDSDNRTCLHHAATYGWTPCIKVLADMRVQTSAGPIHLPACCAPLSDGQLRYCLTLPAPVLSARGLSIVTIVELRQVKTVVAKI